MRPVPGIYGECWGINGQHAHLDGCDGTTTSLCRKLRKEQDTDHNRRAARVRASMSRFPEFEGRGDSLLQVYEFLLAKNLVKPAEDKLARDSAVLRYLASLKDEIIEIEPPVITEEDRLLAESLGISIDGRPENDGFDEFDPINRFRAPRRKRDDAKLHLTPAEKIADVKARGCICYGCGRPLGYRMEDGAIVREKTVEMHNPSYQELRDDPTLIATKDGIHMGHNYCNKHWSNRQDGKPVDPEVMRTTLLEHLSYQDIRFYSPAEIESFQEDVVVTKTRYRLKAVGAKVGQ